MNKIRKSLIVMLSALCLVCFGLFAAACVDPDDTPDLFTVTLDYNAEQGSVTLSPKKELYEKDDEVILTVAANNGYEVDTFSVSNDATAALTNGSYTLTVTENVTVDVTFKELVAPDGTFSVNLVYDATKGTVTKTPDGKYTPGTEVTINVTPNEGYGVDTFTVSSDANAALDENGNYTLTVPEDNTTVTVTFSEVEVPPQLPPPSENALILEEAYHGTYIEKNDDTLILYVAANGVFLGENEVTLADDDEWDMPNSWHVELNGKDWTLSLNASEYSISLYTMDFSEEYYFVNENAPAPAYTVTLNYDSAQATVTLDPAKDNYEAGEEVTLNVVLAAGYENYTVFVTVNGEPVSLDENGNYTFNVLANTTVVVTLESGDVPAAYIGTWTNVGNANDTIVFSENGVTWGSKTVSITTLTKSEEDGVVSYYIDLNVNGASIDFTIYEGANAFSFFDSNYDRNIFTNGGELDAAFVAPYAGSFTEISDSANKLTVGVNGSVAFGGYDATVYYDGEMFYAFANDQLWYIFFESENYVTVSSFNWVYEYAYIREGDFTVEADPLLVGTWTGADGSTLTINEDGSATWSAGTFKLISSTAQTFIAIATVNGVSTFANGFISGAYDENWQAIPGAVSFSLGDWPDEVTYIKQLTKLADIDASWTGYYTFKSDDPWAWASYDDFTVTTDGIYGASWSGDDYFYVVSKVNDTTYYIFVGYDYYLMTIEPGVMLTLTSVAGGDSYYYEYDGKLLDSGVAFADEFIGNWLSLNGLLKLEITKTYLKIAGEFIENVSPLKSGRTGYAFSWNGTMVSIYFEIDNLLVVEQSGDDMDTLYVYCLKDGYYGVTPSFGEDYIGTWVSEDGDTIVINEWSLTYNDVDVIVLEGYYGYYIVVNGNVYAIFLDDTLYYYDEVVIVLSDFDLNETPFYKQGGGDEGGESGDPSFGFLPEHVGVYTSEDCADTLELKADGTVIWGDKVGEFFMGQEDFGAIYYTVLFDEGSAFIMIFPGDEEITFAYKAYDADEDADFDYYYYTKSEGGDTPAPEVSFDEYYIGDWVVINSYGISISITENSITINGESVTATPDDWGFYYTVEWFGSEYVLSSDGAMLTLYNDTMTLFFLRADAEFPAITFDEEYVGIWATEDGDELEILEDGLLIDGVPVLFVLYQYETYTFLSNGKLYNAEFNNYDGVLAFYVFDAVDYYNYSVYYKQAGGNEGGGELGDPSLGILPEHVGVYTSETSEKTLELKADNTLVWGSEICEFYMGTLDEEFGCITYYFLLGEEDVVYVMIFEGDPEITFAYYSADVDDYVEIYYTKSEGGDTPAPGGESLILDEKYWGNYAVKDNDEIPVLRVTANGVFFGEDEIYLDEHWYGTTWGVILNGNGYTLSVDESFHMISLVSFDWTEEYYFFLENAGEASFTVEVICNSTHVTVTLSPAKDSYAPGEEITVTVVVDAAYAGYELFVTVNGEGEVLENGKFTFNITLNTVIRVTLDVEEEPTPSTPVVPDLGLNISADFVGEFEGSYGGKTYHVYISENGLLVLIDGVEQTLTDVSFDAGFSELIFTMNGEEYTISEYSYDSPLSTLFFANETYSVMVYLNRV